MQDYDDDFLEEENNLEEESSMQTENLENEETLSEEVSSDLPTEEDYLMEQSEEEPSGAGKVPKGLSWTTLKGISFSHPTIAAISITVLIVIVLCAAIIAISGVVSSITNRYIAPKCTKMTVTIGEDGEATELSLEQYLISHIYSATKDMREPHRNLYRLLYIVLNTEVQSSGSCRRTYIPEVDDIYEFQILDENDALYQTIKQDVKEVKDLVMIRRKSDAYYPVSLDGFCYNQIVEEEEEPYYTLSQSIFHYPTTWVEEHVPWHFANCPCNNPSAALDPEACYEEEWNYPDDEEPDLIYVDGGSGTGVSIYGAYYLTTFENRSYESVLRVFYPDNDWEFGSNDSSLFGRLKSNRTCSGGNVPFASTPLSRNEFISLVTEFLSSGNYASWAQYFIDYAGDIYDMGERKGVNPELIYIFARKETSFTDNTSDTAHYNYYGMGHCNTCDHGKFYNSFMEGVEDLFDYFAKKGSIENIVAVYSYLGDYLYNFNEKEEMGAGGCYYLDIIYGDDYERCRDDYYCSPSNTSSCVKTTQEEKDAYIAWQAEKYIEHRQAIFKLGKETCSAGDVSVEANLNIPTQQLKESLSTFLNKNASSVSSLNATIRDNVVDAGVGTRAGVVTAANTLINYMATFDMRIPYRFGGGHGYSATTYDGRNVNKSISSYYGVDPDWGTPITGAGKYTHYGPDCSAFVNWAMKNGGMKNVYDFTSQSYEGVGVAHAMDGSYVGQIGDVVYSSTHIQLIVSVEDGYYVTAESQTNSAPYNPEFKGISYNQMNFVTSGYHIVDLTSFYENDAYHFSESEYITRFDQGSLS